MITYVYVNSFVTSFNFDNEVTDTIKKIGKLDDLQTFNNRFEDVPDELLDLSEDAYNGFINGIVYSQYINSCDTGTFLNPLLMGLSMDYATWFSIMKNDDINREIVYVDVPYETYCELVPKSIHTTKEEYDSHSNAVNKMVNALNEGLRTTLH